MAGVFDDDAGFSVGHALATKAGNEQKLIIAEALGKARAELNTMRESYIKERDANIYELRSQNLMTIATYEYENFVGNHANQLLEDAGLKLKSLVESSQVDKNELQNALDLLNRYRTSVSSKDWIQGRFKTLMETCQFAVNDMESIPLSGYCIPYPSSLPALFQDDVDALAAGKQINVFRVLTSPTHKPIVEPMLKKGPLTLGIKS